MHVIKSVVKQLTVIDTKVDELQVDSGCMVNLINLVLCELVCMGGSVGCCNRSSIQVAYSHPPQTSVSSIAQCTKKFQIWCHSFTLKSLAMYNRA